MPPVEPPVSAQTTPIAPLGAGIGSIDVGPAASTAPTSVPPIPENLPESPRKRVRWNLLGGIAALFIFLAGGGAAYYSAQQNQDLRQQASVVTNCYSVSAGGGGSLPAGTPWVSGDGNQRGVCNGQGQPIIQENRCGACGGNWFPATHTCNAISANNCQIPGSGSGGVDEDEGSDGDEDDTGYGGLGQRCRDPKNGAVCDGSLYCNTATGLCQDGVPSNICSSEHGDGEGSGGTLDPGKCIVCDCGSQCNRNGQCTLNCKVDQNCDAETNRMLGSNGFCGQVDFQDTNKKYCGVKAIKCDGSCAPPTTTQPGAVQCVDIIGRVGVPGSGTAQAVAPQIGEEFHLKCRKVAGAVNYKFRYFYTRKRGTGNLVNRPAVKVVSMTGKKHVSEAINIDKAGFYYGQCKVCVADASAPNGRRCSAWESTSNSAEQLPFREPGVNPGPAEGAHSVDEDDGLPDAPPPTLRPIPEIFDVIDPIVGPPVEVE